MIYPEYTKHWDFYDDLENLFFEDFYLKINFLDGKFGDILSLRAKFFSGVKMEKEEKKQARKVLNEEQQDFLKEQEKINMYNSSINEEQALKKRILSNRERRLKNGNN